MKKFLTLVAILVSGLAIAYALDPGRFEFRYFDAGGHQLRMLISGHGDPTVVFEAGGSGAGGGPLESWERVQPAVSQFARTVTYDRAGIGFSLPGPKPRDARQIALELHTALHNAQITPPYVLVGHSLGGPFNRVFADMYPDEVAGMVLVDPTPEELIAWSQSRPGHEENRTDDEFKDIMTSLDEAHESRVPTNIPVALISAMGPRTMPDFVTQEQRDEHKIGLAMKLKFHQEWLKKIPGSRHIITEDSSHGVPFEQPELIVRTIRETVENIKSPAQPRPYGNVSR